MNAGPEPQSAVETSIIEGGRCTTRPMRVKIQDVSASSSVGRGGVEVAMTVMDSRRMAAVLGMTRTILHAVDDTASFPYRTSSICVTGTPAQIEMRSFPSSASRMPFALRMSPTICGLQPSMTTSAASTPLMLSFWRIVTDCGYSLRAVRILFTDSGLLTHATNFVGVRNGGAASVVGVAVPESGYAGEGTVDVWVIEERMPERIAMPSVPVVLSVQSRHAHKVNAELG